MSETPKKGLLAMLAPRLNYLYLTDRFSCATTQLIAGHPSIKYPICINIRSHLIKMAQRSYRVTILHFFCRMQRVKFFTWSSRSTSDAEQVVQSWHKVQWDHRNKFEARRNRKRETIDFCLNFSPFPCVRARCGGYISIDYQQLGLDARKPVFGVLRTTKAQTSLRIAQSDQRLCYLSYLDLLWANFWFSSSSL